MASDSCSSLDEDFVQVLVRYGQHAKKKCLPKGVGKFELQESCEELFPEADHYFLQVYDEEFSQWVDLHDTFEVVKKTIIQMMDEKKEAGPTKRQASGSSSADERGKSFLQTIQSIKKKFKSKQSGPQCSTKKDKTKSSEITFQMGWLHFNPKRREYVQVRAIKGGGSPTLRLRREATKEEVIMMGKNTFFPNGHSKMGALKDMIIELADFRAKLILEEGWTLDSSSVTGVKLRLYLRTKLKDEPNSEPSSDTESDLPDPELSAGPSATCTTPPVNDSQDTTSTAFQLLASALGMQASTPEDQLSALGTQTSVTEVQAALITGPIASTSTAGALTLALGTQASTPEDQLSALGTQTSATEVQAALITGPIASTSTAGALTSHLGTTTPFYPAGTPTVLFKSGLQGTCGICCDREKDSFLVPCGHTLCLPCSTYFEESTKKECPFCKQEISAVHSLFL